MDLKTLKHKQAMAEMRRRARMVAEKDEPSKPKVEEVPAVTKKPKKVSKPKEREYLVVEDVEAEAEKFEEKEIEEEQKQEN